MGAAKFSKYIKLYLNIRNKHKLRSVAFLLPLKIGSTPTSASPRPCKLIQANLPHIAKKDFQREETVKDMIAVSAVFEGGNLF